MTSLATQGPERKRLFLAAAAAPYRGLEVQKKKQTLPAPEIVIKESIKVRLGQVSYYLSGVLTNALTTQLSNSDSLVVTRVYQSAGALSSLVRASHPAATERSSIGTSLAAC